MKYILSILIVFNLIIDAYSCTCKKSKHEFVSDIANLYDSSAIFLCTVIDKMKCIDTLTVYDRIFHYNIKVKIKAIYFGRITADTLIIYGGAGIDCDEQLIDIEVNKEYFMNASKYNGRYSLGICFQSYLQLNNKEYIKEYESKIINKIANLNRNKNGK